MRSPPAAQYRVRLRQRLALLGVDVDALWRRACNGDATLASRLPVLLSPTTFEMPADNETHGYPAAAVDEAMRIAERDLDRCATELLALHHSAVPTVKEKGGRPDGGVDPGQENQIGQ